MRKHHPDNECIKRRHLEYLRVAKQLSEASVDKAAAAIAAFELSTGIPLTYCILGFGIFQLARQ